MRIVFGFNPAKCTACGVCAIACMDQNDIDIQAGQAPYRRVYETENEGKLLSISVACLHCDDAPCAAACPKGCLFKDESGLTLYSNEACIGCRLCAKVSPYDSISFRAVEIGGKIKMQMEKCDGCIGRIRAGLMPACINSCPSAALSCQYTDIEEN